MQCFVGHRVAPRTSYRIVRRPPVGINERAATDEHVRRHDEIAEPPVLGRRNPGARQRPGGRGTGRQHCRRGGRRESACKFAIVVVMREPHERVIDSRAAAAGSAGRAGRAGRTRRTIAPWREKSAPTLSRTSNRVAGEVREQIALDLRRRTRGRARPAAAPRPASRPDVAPPHAVCVAAITPRDHDDRREQNAGEHSGRR